jgi:hypothetical protein
MQKVARIVLENDRAITSLRYSIATDISGDTKWSFVILDSILKYCSPENAQQFMDSLVTVSGEIMEARDCQRQAS